MEQGLAKHPDDKFLSDKLALIKKKYENKCDQALYLQF